MPYRTGDRSRVAHRSPGEPGRTARMSLLIGRARGEEAARTRGVGRPVAAPAPEVRPRHLRRVGDGATGRAYAVVHAAGEVVPGLPGHGGGELTPLGGPDGARYDEAGQVVPGDLGPEISSIENGRVLEPRHRVRQVVGGRRIGRSVRCSFHLASSKSRRTAARSPIRSGSPAALMASLSGTGGVRMPGHGGHHVRPPEVSVTTGAVRRRPGPTPRGRRRTGPACAGSRGRDPGTGRRGRGLRRGVVRPRTARPRRGGCRARQ
jgi:hypothetical protein